MQSLPRGGFDAAQVTALLEAPSLTVEAGCELLNPDLTFREDISDDFVGGRVSRNLFAAIHGTCDLDISRALVWGVDLVRPYMILRSGVVETAVGFTAGTGIEARFNVGVYCLTTPERNVGEVPETFSVQGYDRLMLLSRQVGADYSVAAGVTYRAAILAVFTAAGLSGVLIEGAAADDTLPAAKLWPLVGDRQADPDQTDSPVTYLRVVNDLLRAINFRAVYCDENGLFRCEAYRDPSSRATEWTFDADSGTTIVGEGRKVVADVWATPNRWVFRQSNRASGALAPTEGDGIFTVVNQSNGPTSIDARGLTWTAVLDYEAASQAKLVSLGNDRVAADLRTTTRLEFTSGPLPVAGHADVVQVVDSAAGIDGKAAVTSWELPLTGEDMTWNADLL